jgi:tetratricopeptide (TPR) repeat protein
MGIPTASTVKTPGGTGRQGVPADNQSALVSLGTLLSQDLLQKRWNDAAATLAELDKLMPEEQRTNLNPARFVIALAKGDFKAAGKWASDLSDTYKDNAIIQNNLAWNLTMAKGNTEPDLALADKLATRANDASGGKDPSILDTLARVKFLLEKRDEAIQLQEKAVSLAGEDLRAQLEKTLGSYREGKLPPTD